MCLKHSWDLTSLEHEEVMNFLKKTICGHICRHKRFLFINLLCHIRMNYHTCVSALEFVKEEASNAYSDHFMAQSMHKRNTGFPGRSH